MGQQWGVELGEIAEAAEGERVVVVAWDDFWRVGRLVVAPGAGRKGVESFGVEVLICVGGVAEAVVDLGQAGGVGVAEVGDLDGGGFAGEEGQAIARGVAGEVDENVDGVGGDGVGGVVVGE